MKRTPRRSRPARGRALPPWLPSAELGAAILLSLLALGLHVAFLLHAGALWRDEVNSVDFATMPSLSGIWHSLRYDSFPLLSTVALRGWTLLGLGHTDGGYRVFGFLVGVGFVGALWITCRLLGGSLPLFSLTLVGLAPWVVRSVDSIRPYGLGITLMLLTLGVLWRAVRSPTAPRFVAAGALAVLSVQCMYQNAFLLLAVVLAASFAAWRASGPRTALGALLVGVVAAASLLPYIPSIRGARSWGMAVQTPFAARDVYQVLLESLGAGGSVRIWAWLGLTAVGAALGVGALLRRPGASISGKSSSSAGFGAAVLLLATVVFLIAARTAHLQTQPWYYVPLMALLAPVLDSLTWESARTTVVRLGRLVLVLGIAGATIVPGWNLMRERRTNVDAIASYLETRASVEDLIVVHPFWIGVTFQRYYGGKCPWITIPPVQDLRIHRFDLFKEAEAQSNPIDPVLGAMSRTLQSGHRVWLVAQGLPEPKMDQPAPTIPPAPHPTYGWACGPYLFTWGQQAAYYLTAHALEGAPLPPLGRRPVSGYEDLTLIPVSGWR